MMEVASYIFMEWELSSLATSESLVKPVPDITQNRFESVIDRR